MYFCKLIIYDKIFHVRFFPPVHIISEDEVEQIGDLVGIQNQTITAKTTSAYIIGWTAFFPLEKSLNFLSLSRIRFELHESFSEAS